MRKESIGGWEHKRQKGIRFAGRQPSDFKERKRKEVKESQGGSQLGKCLGPPGWAKSGFEKAARIHTYQAC